MKLIIILLIDQNGLIPFMWGSGWFLGLKRMLCLIHTNHKNGHTHTYRHDLLWLHSLDWSKAEGTQDCRERPWITIILLFHHILPLPISLNPSVHVRPYNPSVGLSACLIACRPAVRPPGLPVCLSGQPAGLSFCLSVVLCVILGSGSVEICFNLIQSCGDKDTAR